MWRDAGLVAGRDLRIELRSKVGLWQILPFAVLVLLLFAFALGPSPAALRHGAPGLFWLAVLFSSVLAAQRSIAIEGSPATRELTRLLGLDPAGIFVGKVLAMLLELLVLEALLIGGIVLLFHVVIATWWLLLAVCVLAALGLSSASVLYGSLAGGARTRATLLPVLVLPVLAPVLIAGTRALAAALENGGPDGLRWLSILAVFAVVYTVLGIALYGPLEES